MAARTGVVPGGESGELELTSLPSDPQTVRVDVPANFAHQEIQNMLWIEGSPEHLAALRMWESREAYLRRLFDDKKKESTDLMKEIVNFVWFFLVFQGVVLTVVSQLKASAKPLCGIVWVPALLSGVAAVVTIIGISINFTALHRK